MIANIRELGGIWTLGIQGMPLIYRHWTHALPLIRGKLGWRCVCWLVGLAYTSIYNLVRISSIPSVRHLEDGHPTDGTFSVSGANESIISQGAVLGPRFLLGNIKDDLIGMQLWLLRVDSVWSNAAMASRRNLLISILPKNNLGYCFPVACLT
jgi:hypothetical protein